MQYDEMFMTYCERGEIKHVMSLCNGPFIMVQQGIDIAVRKNDMDMLRIILANSRECNKLIRYTIDNYFDACLYLIELLNLLSPKILYELICIDKPSIKLKIKKYLTESEYIKLRAQTLQLFNAHTIIHTSRYLKGGIVESNYKLIKIGVYNLLSGVIVTDDMHNIKMCIDIMLVSTIESLNNQIYLLNVCDYARKSKLAKKIIKETTIKLKPMLDEHFIPDITNLILEQIF